MSLLPTAVSGSQPSRLTPPPAGRRGFALLITITLLAFLVLLLVSLASLTRVETQVASNNQQLAAARQNALMALNIALGQLQKNAGPDQRITTTADLAGGANGSRLANATAPTNTASLGGVSNGLTAVQPGTRYWTGVWGNSKLPADVYTSNPTGPVLLGWLVSGNESTTFTRVSASTGQIAASNGGAGTTAPSFNPSNTTVLPTSPMLKGQITSASGVRETVLLAGSHSTGDNSTNRTLADGSTENYYDRYVVAPLVDIVAPAGSLPGLGSTTPGPTIGRYAYWVSDEGVKAKYNIVDPYASQTDPAASNAITLSTRDGDSLTTTTGALARYRLLAAQRNGLETLTGLNYNANSSAVGKVLENSQIRLAGTAAITEPQLQTRLHDLTTHSRGVIADTLNGGLRKDLTAYLENTNNRFTTDLAGSNIVPSPYSPTLGPKWDVLKSYYDLASSAQSGAIDIRPPSATQMGVFPIVSDIRMLFGLAPTSTTDYTLPGQALFSPIIVLTNPYTVDLRAPNGLYITFKLSPGRTAFPDYEPKFAGFAVTKPPSIATSPPSTYEYRMLSRDTAARQSLLDGVVFTLPANFTIPAGQSAIFSITSNQVDVGNTVTLTQGPITDGSTFKYFGKTVPFSSMNSRSYRVEDSDNTAPINVDFYTDASLAADKLAKRIERINIKTLDDAGAGFTTGVSRRPGAFPMALFLANINYPGDKPPSSTAVNNRNRTLRIFADFNLRSANSRQVTWTYSTPPYFYRWIKPAGWTTSVPPDFTLNLTSGACWGRDHTVSLRETLLFDVPRRANASEVPVLSLGQLQHADVTTDDDNIGVGHQPGYAIGNSFAPPLITHDVTKQSRGDFFSQRNAISEITRNYYDISYLVNSSLWDRYFFSAIPRTITAHESVNSRLQYTPGSTLLSATSAAKAAVLQNPDTAAAHLMIDGAFNINSTSIEAWKAVLAGTRGLNMPNDTKSEAAFPRSVRQTAESDLPNPSGDEADSYTGFRRLNDFQLSTLATQIVAQVRQRGPFLSLSQFVNRSLSATSAFALQGPLQAAIETASLNNFANVTPIQDQVNITNIPDANPSFGSAPYTGAQSFGTYRIFPGSASNVTSIPPVAEQGYRSTAAPGWITQADILQAIGPILSTRSDTFVIRTYGEVLDPLNSTPANPIVTSRTWCEAIVQRMPDYVNSTNAAEQAPSVSENQQFGRKFRVISFRWLGPEDI